MKIFRNQRGQFQITIGLAIAVVAITLLGLLAFFWKSAEVKGLKAENSHLSLDNTAMKKAMAKQAKADKDAINGCEASNSQLLGELGQCQREKQPIYQGCPTMSIENWEDKL